MREGRGSGPSDEEPKSSIRDVRVARGWSLAHLGVRSGVGISRLAAIEAGARATDDELERLAAVLGVPVAELREPVPPVFRQAFGEG